MAVTISSLVRACLNLYDELTVKVQRFASEHGVEKYCILWEDELGRLRIWTANIGAHQTGQSSLDYRLRDASHIRVHIVKLLEDLYQTLKDIRHLVDHDSLDVASNQSHTPADSDVSIEEGPAAELSELLEDIVSSIECLYRMSMLVRRPARHDFLTEQFPDDVESYDVRQFKERYDKRHVEEKFPKADPKLHRSLGAAITRRRRYMAYRKRHHEKLGNQMEMTNGTSIEALTDMSSTIATEFRSQGEFKHEVSSVAGFSQTSYATSLGDGRGMTIPAPPKESRDRAPFECPYCFYIITVGSRRDWQNHLMGDILPYSCIFPDCSTRNKLFDSRHEWYGHLQKEHRVYNPERVEIDGIRSHTGVKDPNNSGSCNCALCEEPLKSSREFEHHVARHLQELALFALPRGDANDEEDELLDDAPQLYPVGPPEGPDETATASLDSLPGSDITANLRPLTNINDNFTDSTSVHQADPLDISSRTYSHPMSPSIAPGHPSIGISTELTVPNRKKEDIGTEAASDMSQLGMRGVTAPDWKSFLKMVIHLPNDHSQTRMAKLDTGSSVDLLSQSVVDDLGMELQKYGGPPLSVLGSVRVRHFPLGQLRLEWHVMGKKKTYISDFLVLDRSMDCDAILSETTIRDLGFYTINSDVF